MQTEEISRLASITMMVMVPIQLMIALCLISLLWACVNRLLLLLGRLQPLTTVKFLMICPKSTFLSPLSQHLSPYAFKLKSAILSMFLLEVSEPIMLISFRGWFKKMVTIMMLCLWILFLSMIWGMRDCISYGAFPHKRLTQSLLA